jgi:hypothetical protein
MIILIALGLVVLVISIMMFVQQTREKKEFLESCEGTQGVCRASSKDANNIERACDTLGTSETLGKCAVESEICCLRPAAAQ